MNVLIRSLCHPYVVFVVVIAACLTSACDSFIHTNTPTLSAEEVIQSNDFFGTYALKIDDDNVGVVRLWPISSGRYYLEWYHGDTLTDALSTLELPANGLILQLGIKDNDQLVAEIIDEETYFPMLGNLSGDSIQLDIHSGELNKEIVIAQQLGVTLKKNGELINSTPDDTFNLLKALSTNAKRLRAVPINDKTFRERAAVARLNHTYDLDIHWRFYHNRDSDSELKKNIAGIEMLNSLGDPWGTYMIARMYINGYYYSQNYMRARIMATKALQEGEGRAAGLLGMLALYGLEQPVDLIAARKYLTQGASSGDPIALRNLALLNINEQATLQKGLEQLHQAAEKSEPYAAEVLGIRYLNGDGVEKDKSKAFQLLKIGADSALPVSAYLVGDLYANGQGVDKSLLNSVTYYRRSADLGDVKAQLTLGRLLWRGKEVKADPVEAFRRFYDAAEQGDSEGMNWVGLAYASGYGVVKDNQQAVVWYQKAAQAGSTYAKWQLGVHTAKGLGIEKDIKAGLALIKEAIAAGEERAKPDLEKIESEAEMLKIATERAKQAVDEHLKELRKEKLRLEKLLCVKVRDECMRDRCALTKDNRVIHKTYSGPYWFYSNGEMVPSGRWPDATPCYD